MTDLDTKRWVVLDAQANKRLWEELAPGAAFISAETLQMRQIKLSLDWKTEQGTHLPEHPQIIVIHADCHVIAAPVPTFTGIEWAMRLREEANRFHCPILLVSFQGPEYAEIRELQDHGTELLRSFLMENWQARWSRLPLTDMNLQELAREAIGVFEAKNPGETEWRDLGLRLCKGQIERVHRRFKHGRGSFTTALWLCAGAVRRGVKTADEAQMVLDRIRSVHPQSEEFYDFGRFARYLSLLSCVASKPDAAHVGKQKRLLLVEDEYGWEHALSLLLGANWAVNTVRTFEEVHKSDISKYDLVFVDENLGAERASGLDLITEIRAYNPFTPIILFTSNRDPAVTAEALNRGATDVLLKQSSDTVDQNAEQYHEAFAQVVKDYGAPDKEAFTELQQTWEAAKSMRVDGVCRRRVSHTDLLSDSLAELEQAIALIAVAAGTIGPQYSPTPTNRAAAILLEMSLRKALMAMGADQKAKTREMYRTTFKAALPKELEKIVEGANSARHGRFQVPTKTCAKRSRDVVEWLGKHGYKVQSANGATRSPVRRPRRSTVGPESDHGNRSRAAAVRLLAGYLLSRDAEIPAPVVDALSDLDVSSALECLPQLLPLPVTKQLFVVDDDAEKDGWIGVLNRVLREDGWHISHIAKSFDDLQKATIPITTDSVILLDLCLPEGLGAVSTQVTGIKCLDLLRTQHPDTPIIIFSATEAAFWARRCLRPDRPVRSRAQGYFPKAASPLPTDAEMTTEFLLRYYSSFSELLNRQRSGMRTGRLRGLADSACGILGEVRDEISLSIINNVLQVPKQATAGAMLKSYLGSEIDAVARLIWIAEDPYYPLLLQRIFGSFASSPKSYTALQILPVGIMEVLLRIVLAIAWNESAPHEKGWQEMITAVRRNRDFFGVLNKDQFDDMWLPVVTMRNQVRIGGVAARADILAPFCNAIGQLCSAIVEAATKRSAGHSPSSVMFPDLFDSLNALVAVNKLNDAVEGTVLGRVRGGYSVDVLGVSALWRASRPNGPDYPDFQSAQKVRARTFHFRVTKIKIESSPIDVEVVPIDDEAFLPE